MIRPAGHMMQDIRSYHHPNQELFEIFREYLQWADEMNPAPIKYLSSSERFVRTQQILHRLNVNVSVEEAHALLLDKRLAGYHFELCGAFLSKIYEKNNVVIVYDFDKVINHLGYGYDGIVINRGTLGTYFGQCATVAINVGTVGDYFANTSSVAINGGITGDNAGKSAHLFVANAGTAGKNFADGSWGWVLPLKEPRSYGTPDPRGKMCVLERDEVPQLRAYITELLQCAKEEPLSIPKRFGSAKQVKKTLEVPR